MEAIADQLGAGNTLTDELLIKAGTKDTPEYEAIEVLLKGWEITISDGGSYTDKDGNERSEVRTKWWLTETTPLFADTPTSPSN